MDSSDSEVEVNVDAGSASKYVEADASGSPMARTSLAEKLWPAPLHLIVADPKRTAVIWSVSNLVFVGIGETISILCWLLTTPGFFLFLFASFYCLAYNIARAVTYPGFLSNVRRSLEKDISKEVKRGIHRVLRHYTLKMNYIGFLWVNQRRYLPLDKVVQKLVFLQSSSSEGRQQIFDPILRAIKYHHGSCGNRTTLLQEETNELVRLMECFIVADEVAEELLVKPSITSLLQSGIPAFAEVVRPAIEFLSVEPSKLCDENLMDLDTLESNFSTFSDAETLRSHLVNNPSQTLEANLFFLRAVNEASKYLQDHISQDAAAGMSSQNRSTAVEIQLKTMDSNSKIDKSDGEAVGQPCDQDESGDSDDDAPREQKHDIAIQPPLSGTTGGMMQALRKTFEEYRASKHPLNAIANIDFMRSDLELRLGGKQSWIRMRDGIEIDSMLIPGCRSFEDNRTILMCNPNCGIYEFAMYQCQWVKVYTEQGINVLVYNYRGYARSGGWPSPEILRRDGEDIVKYLHETLHVKHGWVGIHAESIGGVVACHLAKHAEELGITYLVADRTLCDLPTTAGKMLGNWAGNVIRRMGWLGENVDLLLSAPSAVHRMVTCDPSDEIISNHASLKAGVARRLIEVACNTDPVNIPDSLQRIYRVALHHTGGAVAIGPWARDKTFFDKLGTACMNILEAQRDLGRVGSARFRLNQPLVEVVKLLWFADGLCGQCLGNALAEYQLHWKESPSISDHDVNLLKESGKYLQGMRSQDSHALSIRSAAVMDWAYCYLVWGSVSPPISDLVNPNSQRKHVFNICGENGVCGPHIPIPLLTVVRLLSKFLSQFSADLGVENLSTSVEFLIECFTTMQNAQRQSCLSNINKEFQLSLLPLSCGHNGRVNEAEENAVLSHLRNAGWQS